MTEKEEAQEAPGPTSLALCTDEKEETYLKHGIIQGKTAGMCPLACIDMSLLTCTSDPKTLNT